MRAPTFGANLTRYIMTLTINIIINKLNPFINLLKEGSDEQRSFKKFRAGRCISPLVVFIETQS